VIELARSNKSSSEERELVRAATWVQLGATLQMLESETKLPRERLLRLYQAICRKPPPAGVSPIPADWFMQWQPNTHAAVFLNVYEYLATAGDLDEQDALVLSYQLYREQLKVLDLPEVLSLAHVWRLVKYVDAGQLMLKPCHRCEASFVVHTLDLHELFVCDPCQAPAQVRNGAGIRGRATAQRLN
jgi:flagellar transcriptional activator FlhC